MKYTLSSIFDLDAIESVGSEAVLRWFMLILTLIMLIDILTISIMKLLEIKRKPYIVNESFLKMEEKAGIDLCNCDSHIKVNHRYCTGNFIVKL